MSIPPRDKDQSIRVTTIIPCCGTPDLLERAVNSVRAQQVKSSVVIIDDGSTPEDAAQILVIGNGIGAKVIRFEDRCGPANARNAGIAASTTRYIAFLDADDVWLPGKLSTQLQAMERLNLDFSYMLYANVSSGSARRMPAPSYLTRHDLLGNTAIGCSTVMLRRSLVADKQFSDAPVEDFAFWVSLLNNHNRAHLVGTEIMVLRHCGGRSANRLAAGYRCWRTMRGAIGLPLLPAMRYFASYAVHASAKHWMRRKTDRITTDFKDLET